MTVLFNKPRQARGINFDRCISTAAEGKSGEVAWNWAKTKAESGKRSISEGLFLTRGGCAAATARRLVRQIMRTAAPESMFHLTNRSLNCEVLHHLAANYGLNKSFPGKLSEQDGGTDVSAGSAGGKNLMGPVPRGGIQKNQLFKRSLTMRISSHYAMHLHK